MQPKIKSIPDGLYGEWYVKEVNESDYDQNDGTLIKGPFIDTTTGKTLLFLSDSLRMMTPEGTSRYEYRIMNDSLLQLRNKASGVEMEMHIHYLTRDSLVFLNKRTDTTREMRYEIQLSCKRKLNTSY